MSVLIQDKRRRRKKKKKKPLVCGRKSMAFIFHVRSRFALLWAPYQLGGSISTLQYVNMYRYHYCDITTMERTTHHIIFVKTSLFFIVLFFILQKRDYTLYYHKDTTTTLQQESSRSTHNFLHRGSCVPPPYPNQ